MIQLPALQELLFASTWSPVYLCENVSGQRLSRVQLDALVTILDRSPSTMKIDLSRILIT